jgi:hypothetical protein
MLVVRFAMEISNGIHPKDFMDGMTYFSLEVVTEQGRGRTVEVDEIF